MLKIIYSQNYDLGLHGFDTLSAFNNRKPHRLWKYLHNHFGRFISDIQLSPRHEVKEEDLLLVHSKAYIDILTHPAFVSIACNIPKIKFIPHSTLDFNILRPMRWVTQGTIMATEVALNSGFAINLGGGYHNAKPEDAENFCIYSDIGVAILSLIERKLIAKDKKILYIDTDAHQGNGVCHVFEDNPQVFVFDIFNSEIQPGYDLDARKRIDCAIEVSSNTTDKQYLTEIKGLLPGFINSFARDDIGLVIYNAGTNIMSINTLGGMNLSPNTLCECNLYVISELRKRSIPTAMLLNSGYSTHSYRTIAKLITTLIEREKV